jgi:hypothetical protein
VAGNNSTLKNVLEQAARRLDIINARENTKFEGAEDRVHQFSKWVFVLYLSDRIMKISRGIVEEMKAAEELLGRGQWEKILESDKDTKKIVDIMNQIDNHLKNFQVCTSSFVSPDLSSCARLVSSCQSTGRWMMFRSS